MGRGLAAAAVVALVLAGCTAAPPPPETKVKPYEAPLAQGFGWIEVEPAPFRLAHAACVAFEGKIWAFGGLDGAGFVSGRAAVYDPKTDLWDTLVGIPFPVHGATAVKLGDRIQIIGGYEEAGRRQATDRVIEYIPASGLYFVPAPLPMPLAEAAAFSVNGIPALGGGTTDGVMATDAVLQWNSGLGASWRATELVLPTPRAGHAFGKSPEGFVAAAGGWAESANQPWQDADLFDIEDGFQSPIEGVPTPRTDEGVGVWRQQVFVVGGAVDRDPSVVVEFFDPSAKNWFRTLDMPSAVREPCVVALDDGLHVVGGFDEEGRSARTHYVLQRISE